MLGFDTVGNATLIAYDDTPVLACDPWICGSAYFGSWGLGHSIPAEQSRAVHEAPYVWFSHAHPDHLNAESLEALRDKTILLANHVGGRIQRDLTALGHRVRVLPDRQWVQLSDQVRVNSFADYNQDSVILVDIGGALVINLNDASDRGWARYVQRIARTFERSYLLRIGGYGDADMINLFDEEGHRIEPFAATKPSVGRRLAQYAGLCGANHVIPFSSFHCYQREDSAWASQYATPVAAHAEGFEASGAEILPAFVRVDGRTGAVTPLRPEAVKPKLLPPSAFGDDWSESLDRDEETVVKRYFSAKRRLRSRFGFVSVRVGGRETVVDLNPKARRIGITFETPRASLLAALEYEVFDDLLIGNFMRTTLHGGADLYPHFTPTVAKHSDNGRAHTRADFARYLASYVARAPLDAFRFFFELQSESLFRRWVPSESWLYSRAKRAYWRIKLGRPGHSGNDLGDATAALPPGQ
ncbi:MAG: MBL fold metallo-hydrolase [Planctomycetota bacterium]